MTLAEGSTVGDAKRLAGRVNELVMRAGDGSQAEVSFHVAGASSTSTPSPGPRRSPAGPRSRLGRRAVVVRAAVRDGLQEAEPPLDGARGPPLRGVPVARDHEQVLRRGHELGEPLEAAAARYAGPAARPHDGERQEGRSPAATAPVTAACSAHALSADDAFCMLAPRWTRPERASIAAPTRVPE